jgi:hypothetical protein
MSNTNPSVVIRLQKGKPGLFEVGAELEGKLVRDLGDGYYLLDFYGQKVRTFSAYPIRVAGRFEVVEISDAIYLKPLYHEISLATWESFIDANPELKRYNNTVLKQIISQITHMDIPADPALMEACCRTLPTQFHENPILIQMYLQSYALPVSVRVVFDHLFLQYLDRLYDLTYQLNNSSSTDVPNWVWDHQKQSNLEAFQQLIDLHCSFRGIQPFLQPSSQRTMVPALPSKWETLVSFDRFLTTSELEQIAGIWEKNTERQVFKQVSSIKLTIPMLNGDREYNWFLLFLSPHGFSLTPFYPLYEGYQILVDCQTTIHLIYLIEDPLIRSSPQRATILPLLKDQFLDSGAPIKHVHAPIQIQHVTKPNHSTGDSLPFKKVDIRI